MLNSIVARWENDEAPLTEIPVPSWIDRLDSMELVVVSVYGGIGTIVPTDKGIGVARACRRAFADEVAECSGSNENRT